MLRTGQYGCQCAYPSIPHWVESGARQATTHHTERSTESARCRGTENISMRYGTPSHTYSNGLYMCSLFPTLKPGLVFSPLKPRSVEHTHTFFWGVYQFETRFARINSRTDKGAAVRILVWSRYTFASSQHNASWKTSNDVSIFSSLYPASS